MSKGTMADQHADPIFRHVDASIEKSDVMGVLVFLSDKFLEESCPFRAYEYLEQRTKLMKLIVAISDLSELDKDGDLLLDYDLVKSKIEGSGKNIEDLLWINDPE